MEKELIWKVSLGCDDYIEVGSAEDALRLGKKFSSLIADIGVYKAENERLRKAGDDLALLQCAESDEQHKRRCVVAWVAAKEGRDAK